MVVVVVVVLVELVAFVTRKFVSVAFAFAFPTGGLTMTAMFEVLEVAFLEPFVLSPLSGTTVLSSTKVTSLSVDPLESFPGTS